ncbi:hypothetical protein FCE95_13245 [Luteimonas gilva]|uniref:Uncharacterized protein n=1 Tax=Luteimonas gilva TaxID=2572684 RepID=A0A4U5JWZ1_9GAMM|nr:hypothetical protein [Luteimonas gilva]TKR31029.1 hypothetical protein FCE95_13245 [Luteimonas gilva]
MQGSTIRVFAGEGVSERHRVSHSMRTARDLPSFPFATVRELTHPPFSAFRRKPPGLRRETVYASPLFRFALRITS